MRIRRIVGGHAGSFAEEQAKQRRSEQAAKLFFGQSRLLEDLLD